MMKSGRAATPEQIMGTCRQLELEAAALYRHFQNAAVDPELCALWETMYREESRHAQLIEELASRRGFTVPAVSHEILMTLVERVESIRREADGADLSEERMLSIAAALEFSEMDDLFGAICASAGVNPDAGRPNHLAPLVEAVMARSTGEGGVLRHLLAALMRLRRRANPSESLSIEPAAPTGFVERRS
jgi:hypothetical protein